MALASLYSNRKYLRLARLLDQSVPGCPVGGEAMAAGLLELLWEKAYRNASESIGDVLDVEVACGWRGEPGALVRMLLDAGGEERAGFIEPDPERQGCYRVHDFWEHAPPFVGRKATRDIERKGKGESISSLRSKAAKARWAASKQVEMLDASGQPLASDPMQTESNLHENTCKSQPGRGGEGEGEGILPAPSGAVRRKKKPEAQLPFRAAEALRLIASASGGRFTDTNPGRQAISIERWIRLRNPTKEALTSIGAYLGSGAESFRGEHLDSRNATIANLDGWLTQAALWESSGRRPFNGDSASRPRSGLPAPPPPEEEAPIDPEDFPDLFPLEHQ